MSEPPHPAFGSHLLPSWRGEGQRGWAELRATTPRCPSPRLQGEGGAQRRVIPHVEEMRRAYERDYGRPVRARGKSRAAYGIRVDRIIAARLRLHAFRNVIIPSRQSEPCDVQAI